MKKNKTTFAKKGEVEQEWHEIDVAGQVLGRMATKIAMILSGKNKPIYTPHVDCGDFVIVTNASKIRVTGRKDKQKIYFRHSDYPGGAKYTAFDKMLADHPEKVIKQAVAGMLPKTRLGKKMITKLKIYAGAEHPHKAQSAKKIKL